MASTLLAGLLLPCWPAPAPQEPAAAPGHREVTLPFPWRPGDLFGVRVTASRERRGQEESRLVPTRMEARLEVIMADEDGAMLTWTVDSARIGDGEDPALALANRLTSILVGAPVHIATDASGTCEQLLNGEELARHMDRFYVELEKTLQPMYEQEPRLRGLVQRLRSQYAADPVPRLLERLRLLTLPASSSWTVGEVLEFDSHLPVPLAGTTVRARCTFVLASVDDDAGTATFRWRQRMDPEEAERTVREALAALDPKAADAPAGDFHIDLADEATMVYDLTTGRPRSMESCRTIRNGDQSQVDRYAITLAPKASRAR